MKKHSKSSQQHSQDSNDQKMIFNLTDLLFIHRLLVELRTDIKRGSQTKQNQSMIAYLESLIFTFEFKIDDSDNEELKVKYKYNPQISEQCEEEEVAAD